MPATAGRVAMPAGNRVVTSNALKVSDRWSSIVGSDPYKSGEGADPSATEKMWADPRLHGDKRKVGVDANGRPMFASAMTGMEKRAKRSEDALEAREREYEEMLEKKRRRAEEEARMAEAPTAAAEEDERARKKAKKEKKKARKKEKKARRKKERKEKKRRKEKREKKKKEKKSRRESSSSSSSSGSDSVDTDSESEE